MHVYIIYIYMYMYGSHMKYKCVYSFLFFVVAVASLLWCIEVFPAMRMDITAGLVLELGLLFQLLLE